MLVPFRLVGRFTGPLQQRMPVGVVTQRLAQVVDEARTLYDGALPPTACFNRVADLFGETISYDPRRIAGDDSEIRHVLRYYRSGCDDSTDPYA
jgi:hypothetical protein